MLAGGVVAADQQMVHTGVGVVFGQQPKPRPRVQPRAVRSGAGGVALPGARRDQGGQRVDADRAGVGGDAPVGRDRQHVAQPVIADGGPQPRVGAVHFVAGHPRGRDVGGDGAVDQRRGQRRLGRKVAVVLRDSRWIAAIGILGPGLGRYRARSISACPRGAA